jgi:hypothetical protein
MFGKKKKKDDVEGAPDEKPSAKAATKSKANRAFDAKEFMLLHAEKFGWSFIVSNSCWLWAVKRGNNNAPYGSPFTSSPLSSLYPSVYVSVGHVLENLPCICIVHI